MKYEILKQRMEERKDYIEQELEKIDEAIDRHKKNIILLEIEQATLILERLEINDLSL